MKTQNEQLPGLTIFRFIAAFYVFIFHCNLRFPASDINQQILAIVKNGAIGMSFFFILSGFVLVYAHKNGLGDNYFKKRFLRIYPAYILMGLITIPFLFDFNYLKTISVLGLFLTMTQSWYPPSFPIWNFGGSWSVSTEFFFYMCFPVLLPLIKRYPFHSLFFSYTLASCIIPVSLQISGRDMFPSYYISPIHRLPEFIFGMSLGVIYIIKQDTSNKLPLPVLIALSAVLLMFASPIDNNSYMRNNFITVPATGIIIYSLSLLKFKESYFIKPFIYLGKISYSFYLMQIPLLMLIDRNKSIFATTDWWQCWLFLFVLNFIAASLSYEIIEKRFHIKKNQKAMQ